jgi:nucleotide-binding universal stress UspA family protein
MSPECIESALSAAESEGTELVVLYIVDSTISDDVRSRMEDLGFLGGVPSSRFLRAMRRERKRQGSGELERICRAAEQRGVACRTELVEGDFLTRALEAAQRESATLIFVARRERPVLSRLMSRSQVDELKEAAPCRVLVHDGGEEA